MRIEMMQGKSEAEAADVAGNGWRITPRESPLTLSLSPWERGRLIALGVCTPSPLPEGEGQGEGL